MRKKVLLAVALLPVWALVAEGGARALLRLRGDPYDPGAIKTRLLDARASVAAIPGLQETDRGTIARDGVETGVHPYVGWDVVGDQVASELAAYRRGDFDERFEVLIVGGSVAALTAAKGMRPLLNELAADPELRARRPTILNHGRGSFKQPQLTLKVAYLLALGYEPDAVVLIDGFNEVALGADNAAQGVNPIYPHWGYYGPVAGNRARNREQVRRYARSLAIEDALVEAVDRALRWRMHKSAILGRWSDARVAGLRAEWVASQEAIRGGASASGDEAAAAGRDPARGEPFEGPPEKAMQLILHCWFESSVQLDAICDAHGIPFLHVLQPTLFDPEHDPPAPEKRDQLAIKPAWREGVRLGYPRMRRAAPRLRAEGVAFLDGTDTFDELEEPTYFDACHFRGEGMRRFAARIGERLRELAQ